MVRIKPTHDAGLGEKYLEASKRLINKDGSFNLRRNGAPWQARNLYQWFVGMGWLKFIGVMLLFYLLANLVFTVCYLLLGEGALKGAHPDMHPFWVAFFFSTQTFTTVGYGSILPDTVAANLLASVEAFCGWSGFALVTGLLYGRFSKPNAKFLFSKNALIAPFADGTALQFRLANMRNNIMMEMEAHTLLMIRDPNGHRRYFNLKLETRFIYFFPLNWTIVHPINEESPLYQLTNTDLANQDAELLIHIKGYDETFGQTIHVRYSYKYNEVVHGARFLRMYSTDEEGNTHLDLNKIHDYELIQ